MISALQRSIADINNQSPSSDNRAELHVQESHINHLFGSAETLLAKKGTGRLVGSWGSQYFLFSPSIFQDKTKKKSINGVFSADNQCISDPMSMSNIFKNYFTDLFTSSRPSVEAIAHVNQSIINCMSSKMADDLDTPFTKDDVKKALFEMKPWKAPGPDGFHAGFFKNQLDLLGNHISKVFLGILNQGQSYGCLNHTNIVLIPKISCPTMLQHFRPYKSHWFLLNKGIQLQQNLYNYYHTKNLI